MTGNTARTGAARPRGIAIGIKGLELTDGGACVSERQQATHYDSVSTAGRVCTAQGWEVPGEPVGPD